MLNPEELVKKEKHVDDLFTRSEQTSFISSLNSGKDVASFIAMHKKPESILEFDEIQCSDGRCPHKGNELSVAGSGILLSDSEFETMLKKNPNIKTITAHADCGAAKLAFAKAKENNQLPIEITTAEEFAKHWAQDKAKKYNLEFRFIDESEFSDSHHHERGIVLDATGNFHPSQVEGLPNMFISQSPLFADNKYISDELNILTGIGTGSHAFGNRLTPDRPFYVMVAAQNEDDKNRYVDLAKEVIKNYDKKVRVDGFVVPR